MTPLARPGIKPGVKKEILHLTVNGVPTDLLVEPNRTLLEVLRDELQLMGTKEGCGTGDCGACTVHLDGRPVNSCLVLAVEASDCEVTTVEGLARDGQLHPVQEMLVEHLGMQCGICTPGIVMSAAALLRENPNPTEQEIRLGIAGNLCRCTGYDKIVKAIAAAAKKMEANR